MEVSQNLLYFEISDGFQSFLGTSPVSWAATSIVSERGWIVREMMSG